MDCKYSAALLLLALFVSIVDALNLENIVGGTKVQKDQLQFYPYVVSIRNGTSTRCTGILIAPDWVLTAAHCFIPFGTFLPDKYGVVAGEISVFSPKSPVTISSVYTHLLFTAEPWVLNDIAVAKLETSLPVGPGTSIDIASLPKSGEDFAGQNGTVIGLGYDNAKIDNSSSSDDPNYSYSYNSSEQLSRLEVWILPDAQCYNTTVQMCIRSFNPKSGVCSGDSGGPLVVNNKVVGITSHGPQDCDNSINDSDHENKYTKVAVFLDWINDAMTGQNSTKLLEFHNVTSIDLSTNLKQKNETRND